MSSQYAKLKEELDAKKQELQRQQATIDSIEQVTRELEAQKQEFETQKQAIEAQKQSLEKQAAELINRQKEVRALEAQAADLINRQREVRIIQKRLDALAAVEPAINAAIQTRSSTLDVVKHVVETAIRSDQMTASEIVQTTLDTAIHVNGRSRSDNLEDFLIDLIKNEKALEVAIDMAMDNFADINDVVVSTLAVALSRGWTIPALRESVIRTVNTTLPPKTANGGSIKKKDGK